MVSVFSEQVAQQVLDLLQIIRCALFLLRLGLHVDYHHVAQILYDLLVDLRFSQLTLDIHEDGVVPDGSFLICLVHRTEEDINLAIGKDISVLGLEELVADSAFGWHD